MTVDDEEPQLLCQEIASERALSIDNALAISRKVTNRRGRGRKRYIQKLILPE
jgi:hypothetical protein